jgi:hypothetical protein
MARGKKLRTAANSDKAHAKVLRHGTLEPPSDLTGAARVEYDRLVGVLAAKGTLDRVDLGVVAEAARAKDWLDRSYKVDGSPSLQEIAAVSKLTSQRRGLLRELGLTLIPSRSVVRTNPVPAEADPIAGKIKLSG